MHGYIMKRMKAALAVVLLLLLWSGAAYAGGHYGGHYYHGPNVRFGVTLGGPLWYGGYYSPYYYSPYYYPPAYYPPVSASPPVYIERGEEQPALAPQQQAYWYYCAEAKGYYPYVKECPRGWQQVPPSPPR